MSAANRSEPHWTRFYTRKVTRHPLYQAWKAKTGPIKYALPNAWRIATQQWRQFPTVVIVGAQKAGTTQLHAHLLKHPRLFAGANKEVSYFSKNAHRSVAWYRSRFPLQRRVAAVEGHVLDSSPSYMPNPQALRQMKTVLPDAKIIALLRDPVARAFSHYQHIKTRHREARSFAQAISDELRENRLSPRFGAALAKGTAPMQGYVARGYYALQLELIYEMYSRDQVLIIDSAELFADTSEVCQRVFSFIGIGPFDVRSNRVLNRGYYKERMDADVENQLRVHYGPYDDLLAELTGRQFSWVARKAAA
jgi:hypothetical protein